jgi:hypothetical protein
MFMDQASLNEKERAWKAQIDAFVDELVKEPIIQKHLYRDTWLSGSSTVVYPIEVNARLDSVSIQIAGRHNYYKKFIQRVVENHPGVVVRGYFRPNDGSCPAEIEFKLNGEYFEMYRAYIKSRQAAAD